MPFGARIQNAANTIQVDETFKSMAYRFKVTVNTAWWFAGSSVVSGQTYLFEAVSPLVAVASSATVATRLRYVSGAQWKVDIIAQGGIGTAVTLYVFDNPATPTHRWGLKVLDASGNVTFHNNHRYINVAGFRDFPRLTGVNYMPVSHGGDTLTSGRTYAASCGVCEWSIGSNLQYVIGTQIINNVVDYRSLGIASSEFLYGDARNRAIFTIVDVTGY